MWRLNFLVTVVCIVLQNSYMLYYICPMHTIFTIFVYGALGIGAKYNASTAGILIKCVPGSAHYLWLSGADATLNLTMNCTSIPQELDCFPFLPPFFMASSLIVAAQPVSS